MLTAPIDYYVSYVICCVRLGIHLIENILVSAMEDVLS